MSAPSDQRLAATFDALAALDARIDEGRRLTLDPARERPTSLVELAERVPRAALREPFAEALLAIAEAQLRAFPGNVFWDLDAVAASIHRQALAAMDPVARLGQLAGAIARLQSLFGGETTVRFRYVHDFVYGFDWAKWVKRDRAERAAVGPFEAPFLAYSEKRGGELIELIAKGDPKYHPLPDAGNRNPFRFSREPEDEIRLFRDLAERDLLPVHAWELEPEPVWDRPFQKLREERAVALGPA